MDRDKSMKVDIVRYGQMDFRGRRSMTYYGCRGLKNDAILPKVLYSSANKKILHDLGNDWFLVNSQTRKGMQTFLIKYHNFWLINFPI